MLLREVSNKKFQVDALDGLRGIAVLIVIASHTSNISWYFLPMLDLRGIGKSGVYLFFLLSAYLLTQQLLDHGKRMLTREVLLHYFHRRFFRIYPIFTLYLLFAAATTAYIHHAVSPTAQGIPFSLTISEFFQHLFLLECKGVTWSIAAEFKFYFALPLLAFALFKLAQVNQKIALTAASGLIALCLIVTPYSPFLSNYQSFWVYLPIFILGMMLALIQQSISSTHTENALFIRVSNTLSTFGIGALIYMTPSTQELLDNHVNKEYFHEYYFSYGLAWATILFAAINIKGYLQAIFSSRPLRFLGGISFSLYLFHPIFIFLLQMLHINTPYNAWFVLLLSSISAYFSFKFIEHPLSKMVLIK